VTPEASAIVSDIDSWSDESAADDTAQILSLDLPNQPDVLLVDDDPLVLARLRELVVAAGYGTRTARSGVEALASLEKHPASIVVADVNMPEMDGLALCRRIRKTSRPGYVYLVLLTVRDDESDILAGLEAGADDFLSKRTSPAVFTARLHIARRVLALEYSLKLELEKKRQLAMTDALTGAYNRRYFQRHLTRELDRLRRFGGNLALLLIDVDHFKQVNDCHGHVVGDLVLMKMTRQVEKCLQRATDWFARLGGEEFVVVLEGTDPAGARACAERIRQTIARTSIDTATGPVRVTVSVGVGDYAFPGGGPPPSLKSLLEQADANLYASKSAGRNRVTCSAGSSIGTQHPAFSSLR